MTARRTKRLRCLTLSRQALADLPRSIEETGGYPVVPPDVLRELMRHYRPNDCGCVAAQRDALHSVAHGLLDAQ